MTTLDTVVNTDALTFLRSLPDNFVNACISSPPYFGLRKYTEDDAREIGTEETPDEYIAALVEVFREVKRVLRDDGTVWLNLGDSFWSSTATQGRNESRSAISSLAGHGVDGRSPALDAQASSKYQRRSDNLKPKDLIGIPWMVAFALRADGWYLRSDIIWHKPNCMPESVTDRPTKAHEYLFLLSKNADYYYDNDAIKEPAQDWGTRDRTNFRGGTTDPKLKHHGLTGVPKHKNVDVPGRSPHSMHKMRLEGQELETGLNRNKRSVWTVPTQPFAGAHFAVMPQALVEPCVLAGCPKTVCAVCGAPYERVVERVTVRQQAEAVRPVKTAPYYVATNGNNAATSGVSVAGNMPKSPIVTTLGFAPTCTCNGDTRAGVVIDPFFGAGTVGLVAQRLGRHWLGCDINPEYVELARARIAGRFEEYQAKQAGEPYTLNMFEVQP